MKKILALWAVLSVCAIAQLQGAPFITSFSPKFADSNHPTPIIIQGSGFTMPLVLRFGGPSGVRDFTAGTSDGVTIQAKVPVNAPVGSGKIYVATSTGTTESVEDFTIIGPGPYIAGFTPGVGNGGTSLTITGAHFYTGFQEGRNHGTLWAYFKGATTNGVRTNVTSATGTTLTFRVPEGVASGPITLSNATGISVSAASFLVPPRISGFSPSVGRAGTNVIITGTNLLGATSVHFNNVSATDYTVLSNSAIRATVPVNATSGKIRVVTPAGPTETTNNFVIEPTITFFTPASGPVGASVMIFGANFNVGTPVVKFNGVQATAATGVAFGQLTAVVPAGATTGLITVTTTNGTATSAALFYLPAGISNVAPVFGSAGTPITITGTNFTGASAVTFNGVPAAAFSVQASNSIGAIVPFGVSSGPIIITTPAGVFSNNTVNFYGPPLITAFNPNHGLPGTNVTIFGQNFLDASFVRFNGTNASFTVINNTTIQAIVPTNAQTGPITVIAPGGSNTTPENFVLDYAANLVLSVVDSPDPVVVGSNITFVLSIVNNGPFPAPGVTLTDTLVGPAILKAATTTQGSLVTNGFPITGNLGEIASGSSVFVTLTVTAQSVGMITNIATVSSLYPDPTPANNSVTNTTYVQPLPMLNVRRVGSDRVLVSWAAALTNYGLEFKPLLEPTPPWSSLTNLPIIVGDEYQLTETNSEPARYYRLRRLP